MSNKCPICLEYKNDAETKYPGIVLLSVASFLKWYGILSSGHTWAIVFYTTDSSY